jgi:prephenate dehydrogenase
VNGSTPRPAALRQAARSVTGAVRAGGGIGSVVVLGTGLIGTSVALALRERGTTVWLADSEPRAVGLAAQLGAGAELPADGPEGGPADLAVLAMPPAAVAPALAAAQGRGLARCYTDVASIKELPLDRARELGCDLAVFAGGHPLSGRERSGPAAARADLFLGRPWAICAAPETSEAAMNTVTALARACGAEPVPMPAADHDRWVALVSHAPHLVAAAMAARLEWAPDAALALAGQGLRDVTRIAAGDVALWTEILTANATHAGAVLRALAADITTAAVALEELALEGSAGVDGVAGAGVDEVSVDGAGVDGGGPVAAADAAEEPRPSRERLTGLLQRGATGVARIPGKRGGPAPAYAVVQVVIGDQPGELARLFAAAGDAGINVEDVGIEHSPGLPVGVAELSVRPEAATTRTEALAAGGWPVRR